MITDSEEEEDKDESIEDEPLVIDTSDQSSAETSEGVKSRPKRGQTTKSGKTEKEDGDKK